MLLTSSVLFIAVHTLMTPQHFVFMLVTIFVRTVYFLVDQKIRIIIYMYVPFIFLYISCCNYTMLFISSLRSSGLIFKIFLICLASARCNPSKPVSRGSLCGISITATNLPQPPLLPNSMVLSSSHNTLPKSIHHTKVSG